MVTIILHSFNLEKLAKTSINAFICEQFLQWIGTHHWGLLIGYIVSNKNIQYFIF